MFPVKAKEPDYPGFKKERRLSETFGLVFKYQVTLPFCMGFLLLASSLKAEVSFRPSSENSITRGIKIAQNFKHPEPSPCKGKVAIDPPPCEGRIAPPCRGDVAVPFSPPCQGGGPNHPPVTPIHHYRIISLKDFYGKARNCVGMRLRLSGKLGRMNQGNLVDEGYYIFQENNPDTGGALFGCPIIGSTNAIQEGAQVTIEGIVVRRRGNSGTFYAIEIENIYPSPARSF